MLHHPADALFNMQSSQNMYNSIPSSHQEFISDLDAQNQQQAMKLSGFPVGPYRSSAAFPSAFSNHRQRLPLTSVPSKPYRDTTNLFPLPTIDSFPPRMTSPPHNVHFDPRSSYDLTPTNNANMKQSYVITDYNTVLPSHNSVKQNGVAPGHGAFSTHPSFSQNVISQTPYGPHLPVGNGATANANTGALPQPGGTLANQQSVQEEISTIFVVGFPEDMQEREFQNMFTFSPGFEAATLKIPNKEFTAYNGATANGTRGDSFNPVQTPLVDSNRDIASWPNNSVPDDQYVNGTANGNGNLPPRKQIIGFAKFRTREQALDARDVLQGRRVDIEKGAVLKAEMAKKNLHTKRGVGPTLPGASGLVVGVPSLINGSLGLPQGDPAATYPPTANGSAGSGEGMTAKERELGTLGAMGLSSWPGRATDTSTTEDKERERKQREAGMFSAMGIGGQRSARIRAEEHDREKRKERERQLHRQTFENFHSVALRQGLDGGLLSPSASTGVNPIESAAQQLDEPSVNWNDLRNASSQRSNSPPESGSQSSTFSPSLQHVQARAPLDAQLHASAFSPVDRELSAAIEALTVSTGEGNTSPQLPSPESGASSGSNSNKNSSIDQNPPINTLYVGNLPMTPPPSGFPHDHLEESLCDLFSKQPGFRRLCFRTKNNGPMCFVEFEDVSYATRALNDLYGNTLNGLVKGGGIRLSYSKNPLGVRTPTSATGTSAAPLQQQQSSHNDSGFVGSIPFEAFKRQQSDVTPTILRRDTVSSIPSPSTQQSFGGGSFMVSSPPPPRFASPPVTFGVSGISSNFSSNARAFHPRPSCGFGSSSPFSPFSMEPSSNMIPNYPDHDLLALRDQQQLPSPQHFSLEATRAS